MKLKFWKKDDTNKDEVTLEVRDITSEPSIAKDKTIYVKAQSPEKALDLYDKLKERQKQ